MKERIVYEAMDGAQFTDPDRCLHYERLLSRWKLAMDDPRSQEVRGDGDLNHLNLDSWAATSWGSSTENAEVFLARMEFLQWLAAFMATEA